MNPVMAEKVTDVIRQLDNSSSAKLNFTSNQRLLKMNQIEDWMKKRKQGLSTI